jgi:hypothetical protein
MLRNRFFLRITLLAGAWLISNTLIDAQTRTPVRANGLCNTGLTPKSPLPAGCLASTLVNPINPQDGGSIVDGNWDLAQPFPSAAYTQPPPNPCVFTAAYRAVPVSSPSFDWYNPDDHISQWIEPQGGSVGTPPGWYIYRTSFPIPAAASGYSLYELAIHGQFMADNYLTAIYVENPAGDEAGCRQVAAFTSTSTEDGAWQKFQIDTTVFPETNGYLYFVVYNSPSGNNPTGLRVEFTSPYLLPY